MLNFQKKSYKPYSIMFIHIYIYIYIIRLFVGGNQFAKNIVNLI